MNKIRLIIGFMVIAMGCLVAFQWFWIEGVMGQARDIFHKEAQQAINATAIKIEQEEITFLTKQRIDEAERRTLLEKLSKGSNAHFIEQKDGMIKIISSEKINYEKAKSSETKSDVLSEKKLNNTENSSLKFQGEKLNSNTRYYEKLAKDYENKQNSLAELSKVLFSDTTQSESEKLRKMKILSNVLDDLETAPRNLKERVNYQLIDTLLKKELIAKGLPKNYTFWVFDGTKQVIGGDQKVRMMDSKSGFKAFLFGNQGAKSNQYLWVEFPNENTYILRKNLNILLSAIMLLVFIGAIFYYAISMMLSQSKLAVIKNDFINNMTHELKTPVATIQLAVEMLKDGDLSLNKDMSNRYLDIVQDENKRLASHVEKVLNMARFDKGDIKLNLESLELMQIINAALDHLKLQIESVNAAITIQASHTIYYVLGDKVHLTNIIFNLVENALKYSKDKPEIEISVESSGEYVKLVIADNGIGIQEDHVSKIFDKFYRVPTGNLHNTKGYGLGLSYVKNMIELHKGKISVSSKKGLGTQFTILLKCI
ncbi:MAG: sensor histidine kinase [Leadbetterella sp.]